MGFMCWELMLGLMEIGFWNYQELNIRLQSYKDSVDETERFFSSYNQISVSSCPHLNLFYIIKMSEFRKPLLLFLLLIPLISCQTGVHCNYQDMKDVKIGQHVMFCLHLSNGRRLAFPVKVDKYSGLKPSGVYQALRPNSSLVNSSIMVQFKNETTKSGYLYGENSTQQVSDIYSFVIRTEKGRVLSIESDNPASCKAGCNNCRTVDNDQNCYRDTDDTNNSNNDPKIFLSWIGTDRSGDYMLSQTLRISRFTEYAVGNAYADAVKIFK